MPKNRVVWDLGYFGEERKPRPEGSWIGIGHSFGLIHLMANLQGCCGLIGLQGFLNFLGDGDLRERRQRELSGLQKAFRRDPAKTLQSFYKACGASIAFSKLNKDPLQRDLDALELAYAVPDLPILLMGAEDDIIVPPELIYNNAASHSNVTVEILDRGKHALGHLHPKAVISLFQKHFNNFNENLAAQRPQS
ncbi:MAG: hypothetical protein A2Y14_00095 [Verrucomicrobia bacterium GWF2_51_19]|nr:MAG: hypothetical protein A2Y14_00095 [Verrucomicrobia bacterium GWF2_51_19]HCJ11888.1 hypothetical protein [Opitutae bacterium]